MLFRSCLDYAAGDARVRFNPPSGFVLFRSVAGARLGAAVDGFNPPSGFVLFRRHLRPSGLRSTGQVSIRQADLCCFEGVALAAKLDNVHRFNPPSGFVLFRSLFDLPDRFG